MQIRAFSGDNSCGWGRLNLKNQHQQWFWATLIFNKKKEGVAGSSLKLSTDRILHFFKIICNGNAANVEWSIDFNSYFEQFIPCKHVVYLINFLDTDKKLNSPSIFFHFMLFVSTNPELHMYKVMTAAVITLQLCLLSAMVTSQPASWNLPVCKSAAPFPQTRA